MQYTVQNVTRRQKVLNLPSRKDALYLPPRGKALLTEEEFKSTDVQALVRQGFLRLIGGEG